MLTRVVVVVRHGFGSRFRGRVARVHATPTATTTAAAYTAAACARVVRLLVQVVRHGGSGVGVGKVPTSRSSAVGHEPARNGSRNSDESEERRHDHREDEPQTREADVIDVLDPGSLDRSRRLGIPLLEGQDRVRLNHDLLAQGSLLEGIRQEEILVRNLAPTPAAVRVDAVTVDRRTGAEADADVTLEAQVVAGRELEGIEARHQGLLVRIVLPVPEDTGIRGTSVVVRHFVLELSFVLHRACDAGAREAAVDDCR